MLDLSARGIFCDGGRLVAHFGSKRGIVYENKASAGKVLAAKRSPHRPGIPPALGVRAGSDVVFIVTRTVFLNRVAGVEMLGVEALRVCKRCP
jgi:hypothetical protein